MDDQPARFDGDFADDAAGLRQAVHLLHQARAVAPPVSGRGPASSPQPLPDCLPQTGLGAHATLELLAPRVLGGAACLGDAVAFAHMDPPTPWITWATTLWNASLNQNLLHPATAPAARDIEERVVAWLAPYFGMNGGHLTTGSTLANLTALWAARERAGVREVAATPSAHLSVRKAAHILGLSFREIPADSDRAPPSDLPTADLSRTALVLTAGATSTGNIDPLAWCGRAAWTHVDAAWAGPLRLSAYAARLAGIERADSVSVSAHKWLFQPKESALVLFRDTPAAHAAISFGGAYLAAPNVGVLGSHGATAVPLLATLLAWGRSGIAARIEHCMHLAGRIADYVDGEARLSLYAAPQTGVVLWQPRDRTSFERIRQALPAGAVSTTTVAGETWLRMVAANPNADADLLVAQIKAALA